MTNIVILQCHSASIKYGISTSIYLSLHFRRFHDKENTLLYVVFIYLPALANSAQNFVISIIENQTLSKKVLCRYKHYFTCDFFLIYNIVDRKLIRLRLVKI